jgi:hypothetical protein
MSNEFSKTEQALIDYFNSGADLAEELKRVIIKNNAVLDDKTIVSLNKFIIAAHAIADIQFELERKSYKLN